MAVVCSSLQLIGPGSPLVPSVAGFDGPSVLTSTSTILIWRSRWPIVSSNCPSYTDTLKNYLARESVVRLSKPRESKRKYEALTPSTDSPATPTAWQGRQTWATRGARAASLRVTLTLYPLAAPVGSGGKQNNLSNLSLSNGFSFSASS